MLSGCPQETRGQTEKLLILLKTVAPGKRSLPRVLKLPPSSPKLQPYRKRVWCKFLTMCGSVILDSWGTRLCKPYLMVTWKEESEPGSLWNIWKCLCYASLFNMKSRHDLITTNLSTPTLFWNISWLLSILFQHIITATLPIFIRSSLSRPAYVPFVITPLPTLQVSVFFFTLLILSNSCPLTSLINVHQWLLLHVIEINGKE